MSITASSSVTRIAAGRKAGAGTRSSSWIDLTIGAEIERLSLAASADLDATGDARGNRLDGNAGANGLAGGAGNDTFLADAAADTLDGGTEADWLDGGTGSDTLSGSAGADGLTGGGGADAFLFDALPPAGLHDLVGDFASSLDRLLVSAGAFEGLVEGGEVLLVTGAAPGAAGIIGPVFLYDTDDGRLHFDADGSGASGAVQVVTLLGAPALAAADIAVIA